MPAKASHNRTRLRSLNRPIHVEVQHAKLGPDGRFRTPEELAARFAGHGADTVSYCGSGVTAAHNILAMRVAGLPEPVLYPGSWSEWIRDPSRPRAP